LRILFWEKPWVTLGSNEGCSGKNYILLGKSGNPTRDGGVTPEKKKLKVKKNLFRGKQGGIRQGFFQITEKKLQI